MPKLSKAESARVNGAKSKGPVTPEGKARSSQNARKHGAYSEFMLLDTESAAEFNHLLDNYIARFRPADFTEMEIVNRLAAATWTERRARTLQAASVNLKMLFQEAEVKNVFNHIDAPTQSAYAHAALLRDGKSIQAYQSAVAESSRQFARALRDLEKLRKLAPEPAAYVEPEPEPQPKPEPAPPEPNLEQTQNQPEPSPNPAQTEPEIDPEPEQALPSLDGILGRITKMEGFSR